MERKLDKDKRDLEEKEEHDEMIRVKAESIELAEEDEDQEIEKAKKLAKVKVKSMDDAGEETEDKAKRPRKIVAKPVRKPLKN